MSEITKRIRRATSVLLTGRDKALTDAYELGRTDAERGHFDTLAALREEDIPGLVAALRCIITGRDDSEGGED